MDIIQRALRINKTSKNTLATTKQVAVITTVDMNLYIGLRVAKYRSVKVER